MNLDELMGERLIVEGLFHYRNGMKRHGHLTRAAKEYSLRLEDGWHVPYAKDGRQLHAGYIRLKDDTRIAVAVTGDHDIVGVDEIERWENHQPVLKVRGR